MPQGDSPDSEKPPLSPAKTEHADTGLWFSAYRAELKRTLRILLVVTGVMLGLLALAIAAAFALYLWRIRGAAPALLPPDVLRVLPGLFLANWALALGSLIAVPLIVAWCAGLSYMLWLGLQLGLMLVLRKTRLRGETLRQPLDIRHFDNEVRGLHPRFRRLRLPGLLAAAALFACVYLLTKSPTVLVNTALIAVAFMTCVVFFMSYWFDWRALRTSGPGRIRRIHGRRASLGSLMINALMFIYLATLVRFLLPLWITATAGTQNLLTQMSAASWRSIAATGSDRGPSDTRALLERIIPTPSLIADINVVRVMQSSVGSELFVLQRRVLRGLYWVAVLALALGQILSMVLYTKTLKRPRALRSTLEATAVGLVGIYGFQWMASGLFMLPVPTLEASAAGSLVVLTLYINWVYSRN